MSKQIPVTAFVVGYNESTKLSKCLPALSFCNEILYFDLGSSDDSLKVAAVLGATVRSIKLEKSVEIVHSKYINDSINDWVLIVDPDELIPKELKEVISKKFVKNEPPSNVGAYSSGITFLFKNRPLRGTPWGGENNRILLVNKTKFEFTPNLHNGRHVLPGYSVEKLEINQNSYIQHYWSDSWSKLINKHRRYLRQEGRARLTSGHTYSWGKLMLQFPKDFLWSFIIKRGYLDGFTGIGLSVLWAWYQTGANFQYLILRDFHKNAVNI